MFDKPTEHTKIEWQRLPIYFFKILTQNNFG